MKAEESITANGEQFNWRLPLLVTVGAMILLLCLFVVGSDVDLLYILIIVPLVCIVCVVLLIGSAIRRRPRQSASALLTLILFITVSGVLVKNQRTVRPWLRWLLWSHHYKGQVLAQNTPINGELKHVEWDGWGGAPVGDWTAYVVFDPTESLLTAAKNHSSGKLTGVPCDVDSVQRLESHWYTVTLSVNEWWGRCS